MKTIILLLALVCLLNTAYAQQAPATSPKTADQRAVTYQGPKVTKDSKALGKKMVQKSKPADAIRTSVRDLPVKK
ncbi:MAG: hypothetical protein ACRYF0_07395 [Janthinobacterium lividum]